MDIKWTEATVKTCSTQDLAAYKSKRTHQTIKFLYLKDNFWNSFALKHYKSAKSFKGLVKQYDI